MLTVLLYSMKAWLVDDLAGDWRDAAVDLDTAE
jgi:hypothetical protein